MAQKYHIVVGTSHCEPMLRNNVDEWSYQDNGKYNYFVNKEGVCQYWQERIEQVKNAENIVTLGMRGIHDGYMQGGETKEEKMHMVEQIIDDQRQMLTLTKDKPIESIATTIILYKEVLDLYNRGMKIPDDVTIMWCDDNHGYIRRLSNEEEQTRKGGAGIYYHLSYWGSPHDYLWLSTTQPSLVWYEMNKAYQNGAKKIWIVNVGDIKPAEYNMEFFLDMAWDIEETSANTIDKHTLKWAEREFGEKLASEIVDIKKEYYRLASIRRPEFLGWSRVEPQTATDVSEFNGRELERRLKMYDDLYKKVEILKTKVSPDRKDAWFQLIEYPIKGASLMNRKFLHAQKASEAQDTLKRKEYAQLSEESYDEINKLTSYYNNEMSSGKWQHMMSMSPRNLNVFKMPDHIIKKKNDTNLNTDSEQPDKQTIFIQANEYKTNRGNDGYQWTTIKGLGYSNHAITLSPFDIHYFGAEDKPYVEYLFKAEQTGEFELQIRCLPTHSNNFDHRIGVQIGKGEIHEYHLNTKGRSSEWKDNIMRNSQIIKQKTSITEAGTHTIRLYVNQTGIVIDQLAVDFSMDKLFYEIPYKDFQ